MSDSHSRAVIPVYWAIAGVLLLALLWYLRGNLAAMLEIWLTSSSFNHCLLIAPASAWLIWRRRERLAVLAPRASPTGVAAFACCAVFWGVGELGNVSTLQNLAAVAMIPSLLWAMLGTAVVREIAFPLAYLFFMVPIGAFLVPWLMELTAELTVIGARLSGVAVYQDGLFFVIPNGSFKIVEACSGIRMLIASVAIAVLFAHLAYVSWVRRIIFVMAMVVVSIIANSIRTYTVVMLGHYRGMDAATGHEGIGYVIFGITIVVMLAAGSRFSDARQEAYSRPVVEPEAPAGSPWLAVAAGVMLVMIALITPRVVAGIESRQDPFAASTPAALPAARQRWTGPGDVRGDWSPRFVGENQVAAGVYGKGAEMVDVHMVSYGRQTQGSEVINSRNRVYEPRRWTLLHVENDNATRTDVGDLAFHELELQGPGGARRLVRYWYVVDGRVRHRPAEIKLREFLNGLRGRATPATFVAISSTIGADAATAGTILDAFIRDVYAPAYPPAGPID